MSAPIRGEEGEEKGGRSGGRERKPQSHSLRAWNFGTFFGTFLLKPTMTFL